MRSADTDSVAIAGSVRVFEGWQARLPKLPQPESTQWLSSLSRESASSFLVPTHTTLVKPPKEATIRNPVVTNIQYP